MSASYSKTASHAFLFDLTLIVLFVALGRRTHEASGLGGLVVALWPFVAALVIAWSSLGAHRILLARTPHSPEAWSQPWPAGVLIWLITAGGGLAIRGATGGSVTGGFPYVTFGMLLAGLVGWRVLAWLMARVRA